MKFRTSVHSLMMTVLLVAFTLPLFGCGNKVTLDQIGNVAVAAALAFDSALVQYLAGGSISKEQFETLKPRAEALIKEAKDYDKLIDGYAEIGPGDISAITAQTAMLIGRFKSTLQDAVLFKIAPNATAIKVLTFAVDSLTIASAIFAGLFPPPAVVTAQAGNGIPIPKKSLKATPVQFPRTDKDTQNALNAAGEKIAAERGTTLRQMLAD